MAQIISQSGSTWIYEAFIKRTGNGRKPLKDLAKWLYRLWPFFSNFDLVAYITICEA